jgi:DNA-binding PadR family transcriptional regulator
MVTRLIVLGLLLRGPLSGYTLGRYLQMSRTDLWAGILPGSIYHALKKLAAEGLVTLLDTEQTGNRTRAIYAITEAGEREYRRLLRDAWSTPGPHYPVALYVALGFLDDLPREEVLSALDQQIAGLEGTLAEWNAGEQAKAQALPVEALPYVAATFANGRAHLALDLEFLRSLRAMLLDVAPFAPPVLPPPDETEGEEEEDSHAPIG